MTDLNKRSLIKVAALTAIAAAALVGCGKKEEPKPAAAAPAAPAASAAAAPPKAAALKIAFGFVGPVGAGGWAFAHDTARK
ncbi:MAG: BMP family ABC transporter substrate-binding protein, partial [Rhodoferax sp.]|nr:BMP family ABC transporter substrate-binding protein [Rhodoferax sp.]